MVNIRYSLQSILDIDECRAVAGPCAANATCTNTDGSYECTCNSGYTGNGIQCLGTDSKLHKSPGRQLYFQLGFYGQSHPHLSSSLLCVLIPPLYSLNTR